MNDILVLGAVILWVGDLVYANLSDNSWKTVGITWGLLIAGAILFGIALMFY